MITNRLFYLIIVLALMVVTACRPQVAVTPESTSAPAATMAPEEPITLRLAVADAQDRPQHTLCS